MKYLITLIVVLTLGATVVAVFPKIGNSVFIVQAGSEEGNERLSRDPSSIQMVRPTPKPKPTKRPPPVMPGLVAWWSGEGNADDIVGSNDGTLQNGATFATGIIGQAFLFDGADDSVQIPVNTSFQSPTLSIVAWVKPLSEIDDFVNNGSLGQEMIFGQSGGTHQLVVQPGIGGMKVVAYWLGGGSEIGAESAAVIPLNEFSHVAGTWDGTTGKVYINGLLEGQAPAGTALRDSSLCPFEIGGLGCFNGQFFNAVIDEVKLFDRALEADEVVAIFNDS